MPEDQIVEQSSTSEETQQPAEAISSVEGAETAQPEVKPESAPEAQPEAHEPPKWAQRRIDQLTREKHEERRQREALEARLAQAGPSTEAPPAEQFTQADIDARAAQIADQRISQARFDDACNAAYQAGKKEFPDFDKALSNFGLLGGLSREFLDAVTDLPDGHKVMYALGNNPDEASRILALPPLKMAVEIARLAEKASKSPATPVSKAPAPITPIGSGARAEADPSTLSDDEWYARRLAG